MATAGPRPKKRTVKSLKKDIASIERLKWSLLIHTPTERGREAVRKIESLTKILVELESEVA